MKIDFSGWFDILKSRSSGSCRLICFPFAGGSSVNFNSWIKYLPDYMELCVISLPGRGVRIKEKPVDDLHHIADQLVRKIHPHITANTIFYGHSMGAALAYEVASRLQPFHPVKHLFFGAFRAPHLKADNIKINDLPDYSFIEAIRKYGFTPEAVLKDKELIELLLPMLRADFKAIENYSRTSPCKLSIPITVFSGKNDLYVNLKHMEAWALYTNKTFQLHQLEGSHLFHEAQASFIIKTIADTVVESLT